MEYLGHSSNYIYERREKSRLESIKSSKHFAINDKP